MGSWGIIEPVEYGETVYRLHKDQNKVYAANLKDHQTQILNNRLKI